jgi:hypothetical protein
MHAVSLLHFMIIFEPFVIIQDPWLIQIGPGIWMRALAQEHAGIQAGAFY